MLTIPGYEGGPLVDGSDFLDEPLFWPGHLGSSLRSEEAQALAFGPEWDAAREVAERVSDAERWPVFSVRLRARHVLHVVHRNLEDDSGVDYLVRHCAWADTVPLAVDDGHFMGPGLSWPELRAVADRPPDDECEGGDGVLDPDARLLLLFPMLGDADVPGDAAPRLTAALSALTIVEEPAALAAVLLRHQGQWEPAHWRRSDGAGVCDGAHSYRNPLNRFALPAARLAEVSDALDAQ